MESPRFSLVLLDRVSEGETLTSAALGESCRIEILSLSESIAHIADELKTAMTLPDLRSRIRAAEYHYQNYVLRTYLTNERVQQVLASLAGVDLAKWRDNSSRFLRDLKDQHEEISSAYWKVRSIVSKYRRARNVLTHADGSIPCFSFYTGNDMHDPYDLVDQLEGRPDAENREQLLRQLDRMLREFVEQNVAEMESLRDSLTEFFGRTDS